MKIIRQRKDEDGNIDLIEIDIDGERYLITDEFCEIRFHACDGKLVIQPCVANEVLISTK
jgi:hypothetical protein